MKKLLYIAAFIILLTSITGCKTKYIEVPTVHTEYISKTDTLIHRDSIYTKDSVYIIQRGDTIYHNAYHTIYKDRLVYNTHTDTIHKTDTVTVVKVEYVEKKQSFISKFRQHLVALLWLVGIFSFAYMIYRIYAKWKQ